MSATSLVGLRVLVTRPSPQQQELVAAVEAAGGVALHLPLLEIRALDDDLSVSRIKNQLQHLNRYQLLIFVSANAVNHGVDWIERYWPQLPPAIECIAIGPSTASLLASRLGETGRLDSSASQPAKNYREVMHALRGASSEDLLRLPRLQKVANQQIAIVRGQGGRELLGDSLRARGAGVDYLEVYQRRPAEYPEGSFLSKIKSRNINVLTVTSGESLTRLNQLLGDNKAQMSLLPLLVPSSRVAEQAANLGFVDVIDTGGADVGLTMAALSDIAGRSVQPADR